jgi:hypothetical protein
MKAASLVQLRKELETCTPKRVIEVALKLAKFKVENKEFLSYMLFDSDDRDNYVREIKGEVRSMIDGISRYHAFAAKKSIRKILRLIARYAKYTGTKETEVTLLIYFCNEMVMSGLSFRNNKAIIHIYTKQVEKIEKLIPSLEEDLQYDYQEQVQLLKDQLYLY